MNSNWMITFGVLSFSISIIAFGLQNFLYGDFIIGRAPVWPASIQGKLFWAWFSGVLLIIFGVSLALKKKPRLAALLIAVLIFFWALLRHILAANWHWGIEITQTGKALTLFGGALSVAGVSPFYESTFSKVFDRGINQTKPFFIIGRVTLALFMIVCGIQHFMFVDFVKQLVPSWIPGEVFWTYFGGVALLAGGAGILLDKTTRLAALLSGIMVFIWFIILHIPRAVNGMGSGNEWIAVFEALAVSGIAFVLAGTHRISQNE